MAHPGVRPYKLLAQHYDEFFTLHHPWFAAARRRILGALLPGVNAVCDLACGTGTTAISLAQMGKRVYAVDVSPAMCRLTREKARREGVPVRVIHADMREFHLPGSVGVVLCEFDALNHVAEKSDLNAVAECVAAALEPGGYFYFDVNTRLAFEKLWPGSWWMERPGVVLCMHGDYDRARDRGWTEVEWFERQGRLWKRTTERVEQVCWSDAEIRRALRKAGFESPSAWDAVQFFTDAKHMAPGCRTFYLARKRPGSRKAPRG